ncbi:MAG: hypothetical protein JO023_28110 [Chloroflexi bacterium]|nr:hypothetical protein [Chloroflexota bacterium]
MIMGNLLVIPLQDSPLFLEPLYIRAQNNPLPQLQRVIVASTQAVVMSDTLPSALQALAAGKHGEVLSTPAAEAPTAAPAPPSGGTPQDLARQALQTYQDAVAAQRQGDWATYGQKLDQLQALLEQLNQGAPSP